MQTLRNPAASLAFRESIARTIAPLRRIRPRVPFWELASHRVPTLRLYRNLLGGASLEDNVRFRICKLFRQHQHLTSPTAARVQLLWGYKLLDTLNKANAGDGYAQNIIQRYGSMIATKREKEKWKRAWREELAWQKKMRSRPILTGTIVRATHSNRPFPRMKPQPVHISLIIKKRRLLRMRRIDKYKMLTEWRNDMRFEKKFEASLAIEAEQDGLKFNSVFNDHEWDNNLRDLQNEIQKTFTLDEERAKTPATPELIAQVQEARREKFRNKLRESERERRGEVLNRTLKRKIKGPPAHVLAKMTEDQKMMDKVSRSVSEVGYVASVKKKLGFKLRNPTLWERELGPREHWGKLTEMERQIQVENLRRRRESDRVLSDLERQP